MATLSLGRYFVVRTDQQSLRLLMNQHQLPPKQLRWVYKLLGYDLEVQYELGASNRVADALPRRGDWAEVSLAAFTIPHTWDFAAIQLEQRTKPVWVAIISKLEKREVVEGYALKNRLMFYKDRLVLVDSSPWIARLVHEFHDSIIGEHSCFVRTYKRLFATVFWRGIKRYIREYVVNCEICQRNKTEALSLAGLLQPLPILTQVWDDVSMDFVRGLPKSGGFDTILVVVDHLSKYAHFVPWPIHSQPSRWPLYSFSPLSGSKEFRGPL